MYICRPSFRIIYLSSISTISNISSVTRMRTRRRDTGANISTRRKLEYKLCDIGGLKKND